MGDGSADRFERCGDPVLQHRRQGIRAHRPRRPEQRQEVEPEQGVRRRQTRQHPVHQGTAPPLPLPGPVRGGVPPRHRRHQLRQRHHQPDPVHVPHPAGQTVPHQLRQGRPGTDLAGRGHPRHHLAVRRLLREQQDQTRSETEPAGTR
ncbi:hypothetical protein [Actinoplanes sp. G11-F43]|uniref:hypothetical protein n=1 Tax=Actinoplanes sp. G11-F43 TaxID=3424130 RepID=UPI003D329514